jgi:DnaJ-class molecular chaperone
MTSRSSPLLAPESSLQHSALREPIDLFIAFHCYAPSIDEIFDRWMQNFNGRMPKAHPPRELNLELAVSTEEAARGGHVEIDVPVASICHVCDGSGVSGFFNCDSCDGHGMSWQSVRVDVLLRPTTRDGTVIPVSLRGVGVSNMYLNVHIRIAQ